MSRIVRYDEEFQNLVARYGLAYATSHVGGENNTEAAWRRLAEYVLLREEQARKAGYSDGWRERGEAEKEARLGGVCSEGIECACQPAARGSCAYWTKTEGEKHGE